MIEFRDPVAEHIKAFILDETAMEIDNRDYPSDPVWREYREMGSRIWIYGNDEHAEKVWTRDMEAIYLDTLLVNKALRQDSFTELAAEANAVLKGLPADERIKEISFIISARNAVASSKRFAARVSVEIPLFSESPSEIGQYARRLYQVCPEYLLPAVPYSTTGLKAATGLQQAGIPVIIRTECKLHQIEDSIRSLSPGRAAADQVRTAESRSANSVQELKTLLNNTDIPGASLLVAFGLDSMEKIRQFMGFPIIVATPSAAEEYQKSHGAGQAGHSYEELHPETGKNIMEIARQSRDSYSELVLLIREVINSD